MRILKYTVSLGAAELAGTPPQFLEQYSHTHAARALGETLALNHAVMTTKVIPRDKDDPCSYLGGEVREYSVIVADRDEAQGVVDLCGDAHEEGFRDGCALALAEIERAVANWGSDFDLPNISKTEFRWLARETFSNIITRRGKKPGR